MAKQIYMLRMGQTMKEGTITAWLKKEGEFVKKGEDLYEMEFDKATTTAEAKGSGYLHIVVGEGETVPVSTVVGYYLEEGEKLPEQNTPDTKTLAVMEKAPEESEPEEKEKSQMPADNSKVMASPLAKRLAAEKGINLHDIPLPANSSMLHKADIENYSNQNGRRATPLAAKMASDNGINLKSIEGDGRVYSKDVRQVIASSAAAAYEAKGDEKKAMSPLRKSIAKQMKDSYFSTPVATLMRTVDVTRMNQTYQEAKEELKAEGLRLTLTDFIIRACASALAKKRDINVSVDGEDIIYKGNVNIGLAVAIDGGLLVPVIKNADKLTMRQIVSERTRLVEAAKIRKLTSEDMSGGTFTITNLGAKGVDFFTPIINPPETAILGVGRSSERVVVENGEMVIRSLMSMSLTVDHRVIDGAPAAEFLQNLSDLFCAPISLLM